MNEAGEQRGLKEQAADAAQSLVDRLRRRFGGENAQQPVNEADKAAIEAALNVDTAEAADMLSNLFPNKFPTQKAGEQAAIGMGAAINRDRRADATREQNMSEITDLLDKMPETRQSSDVDGIMAQMERRAQEQKGQKP